MEVIMQEVDKVVDTTIDKTAESVQERIREAVDYINEETGENEHHIIEFDYTVKDPKSPKYNQKTKRRGEPYEIRGDSVWVYDLNSGGIRRFKLQGISKLEITDEKYEPQFDIKI